VATTHTRTKFALALAASLLALSAPVAYASPEDNQDTENPATIPGPDGQNAQVPSLQLHASENPVHCGISEDWKAVAVTWTPEKWANFTISDNGQPVEIGWGSSKNVAVVCGHTFTVEVKYQFGDTYKTAPLLTITSDKAEIASLPRPQLAGMADGR
jgi:hypothetical protein